MKAEFISVYFVEINVEFIEKTIIYYNTVVSIEYTEYFAIYRVYYQV